jgi:hypothetical protein
MTLHIKLTHLAVGIVAGATLAGGGYALATTQNSVIHACVNNRTHALLVERKCAKGYASLSWNQKGLKGASGTRGATGAAGATGTAGTAGAAGAAAAPASVTVGSVTTGAPGSQAAVTNTGTPSDAKLSFVIPQGVAGQKGADGTDGTDTGPTAYGQVWVGSSTAELAPGNNANLTNVGGPGTGDAAVDVHGCSSAGLAEPVINVTADHDPSDTLAGANNSPNPPIAWVAHWSTVPDFPVLAVAIETTNPTTGDAINSDFSITVTC